MCDAGLTQIQLNFLKEVFAHYPQIEQVKIYGSRAKGTWHKRSDIDLVAFGDGLDRSIIADVLMELDDSDIPYQVDFQDYNDLKNKHLIDHVDRVGFEIYQKVREK